MTKEQEKRIIKLLEGNKNDAERCLINIRKCCIEDKNFISYCEGRLRQVTHTFENLKETCLDDISLETYVAMIDSALKTFKIMLETMVEPIFGKDTSNYSYFEGRVDEMEDTLNLLLEILMKEKNNKEENNNDKRTTKSI